MTENTPDKKISSPRRIAASRANGAKSRGPVTAEGKKRSSKNALKHGLASATIVLTTEDWPAYLRRFQPADDIELDLVEEMVAARWRQQRMWAIESAALDDEIEAQRDDVDKMYTLITPDVRTALAFVKIADESRALALINRYESRYSRQFYRALKALKELQSNRPPNASPLQPSETLTDHRPLSTGHCLSPNEPNPNSEHPPAAASSEMRTDDRQLTSAGAPGKSDPFSGRPAASAESCAGGTSRRAALKRRSIWLAIGQSSHPEVISPPLPSASRLPMAATPNLPAEPKAEVSCAQTCP